MLRWRPKNKGLIHNFDTRNGLVDAYHQLFQQLCQELHDRRSRFCAIASAGPGEGRSTVAINLASVAAGEAKAEVLLIDADTESPSLHKPYDLTAGPGLSDLIAGEVDIDGAIRPAGKAGVKIITGGDAPLSTVTLAESEKVEPLLDQLRSRFAWIFADTAPLLTAPGSARFDRMADGVLLAVRWSSTRVQLVNQAAEKLEAVGANTLGVVLTQRHFVIPSYVYRRL